MKRIRPWLSSLISAVGVLWAAGLYADETSKAPPSPVTCPKVISTISQTLLPNTVGALLKQAYREIGCLVTIELVPGRRSIMHFNNGVADGELMRLSVVEPSYSREFVRSAKPLFVMQNAIWRRKNADPGVWPAYGYTLGIKWHEIQSQYDSQDRRYVPFVEQEELLDALNSAKITGYLSSTQGVSLFKAAGLLKHTMVMEQELARLPLYHYLSADFEPAMHALDVVLAQNNIFTILQPTDDLTSTQ